LAAVKIYQYEYTNANLGGPARAKRMGTREYIERVNGWIVEGSEIQVDASKVDAEGKTEMEFMELKAAEDAEAILRSLTPSTPPTEAAKHMLRNAANAATRAIQHFSSQAVLDSARGEAATALNGVCSVLTERSIGRARNAVAAWRCQIASQ
jgi:hypothetical protein